MAINASNSTFVNIKDLPKSQLALDPDLLILETQNGTETITFKEFNVVKTDIDGHTIMPGNLTGSNCSFTTVNANRINANTLYSNNNEGISYGAGFYNRMVTTNGIVTSADYTIGSPEYTALFNLYKSLSANTSSNYKKVFEVTGNTAINYSKSGSLDCVVTNFPTDTTGADVGYNAFNNITQYVNFNLLPVNGSTAYPYVSSLPALSAVSYNSGVLTFRIVLPYANYTYNNPGVQFTWRMLCFYN